MYMQCPIIPELLSFYTWKITDHSYWVNNGIPFSCVHVLRFVLPRDIKPQVLYVSQSPEEGNMVIFHNTLLEEVGQWVIFKT
jgi:hypothetical protein